jgi:hypothetical protein
VPEHIVLVLVLDRRQEHVSRLREPLDSLGRLILRLKVDRNLVAFAGEVSDHVEHILRAVAGRTDGPDPPRDALLAQEVQSAIG